MVTSSPSPKLHKAFSIIIYLFAIIGFFFVIVFIGMQFSLFNVSGSNSYRNESIGIKTNDVSVPTQSKLELRKINECKTAQIAYKAPDTAKNILAVIAQGNYALATKMITVADNSIQNSEISKNIQQCDTEYRNYELPDLNNKTAYAWANSDEWQTLKSALTRDKEIILRASRDSGIHSRTIVASVIGEQFRFFAGLRDAFKSYFEPLKIFGRLSKFSFGIAGLKPETVRIIENNLTDRNSIFYLGPEFETFATYSQSELAKSDDPQLARITDPENNYYSYLYVGLYLNQVTHQWESAGYDISNQPGVLATLYNLGFNRSIPKENPLPGGAEITINGQSYTFGQIAEEFYWSGELMEDFPY